MNGIVRTLLPGKKRGIIVSRVEGAMYQYDESALLDGSLCALRLGQEVSFDGMPDPCESGLGRAINVRGVGVALDS